MKRIFLIIGVVFLTIVVILNICFTANLDFSEHITINYNNVIYSLEIIIAGLLLFFTINIINKYLLKDKHKKLRKFLFISALTIYIILTVLWVVFIKAPIVGDQVEVGMMGKLFAQGYNEEIMQSNTYAGICLKDYMQAYSQQISLAFIYGILFKLVPLEYLQFLRIPNIVAAVAIVIAIYKIGSLIDKKHKINKVLLLVLILTFISIPMLSTFIYGDLPSLALSLFSVYYMMKFVENHYDIKFALFSSIFSMLAYMMRMNSLIFILATVIYLIFNLLTQRKLKSVKENIINLLIILIYVAISIIPTQVVNNYYIKKYDLDKEKAYPNISYFLMAMTESWRGNGWYNEKIGENALKDPQAAKVEYANKIKDRLEYFCKNKAYTFRFYTMKLASMWTENTYSAIRLNMNDENDILIKLEDPLIFYQKTLLVLLCVCSIIVLIQQKQLSINVIYLLLIFMGGFAFHIIWEAKSRYIIPYIVVLIPIASIEINNFTKFHKDFVRKIKKFCQKRLAAKE